MSTFPVRVEQMEVPGYGGGPSKLVRSDTLAVPFPTGSPVHLALHPHASTIEVRHGGTASIAPTVYVATGAPADPTVEPRFILSPGEKRTFPAISGNDIAIGIAADWTMA